MEVKASVQCCSAQQQECSNTCIKGNDKVHIYEVPIIIKSVLYQSMIGEFSTSDHTLIKSYNCLSSSVY